MTSPLEMILKKLDDIETELETCNKIAAQMSVSLEKILKEISKTPRSNLLLEETL